ncbi:FliM/FliN family flagellar motor switch protein [Yersinia mollaretii]|uniref:FliM/FliN family flagellar motor switch protein n=1 Tax=Yersinia mollaretii TaxID=33060 RepID=UPI0005E282EF|nr:FliM/FliN family flagellar motor switch protein [Yersinia mollaretii]CNJ24281.1 type III secretion apparatus protein [Yersinia mollaretii]CNK33671.1 type III secretion apparatus protein [Yersinia mollaretii]CQQ67295.1 type III secretion apparatus protein [Yersinia mollaretii]
MTLLNIRRLSALHIQVMRWQQRYQPDNSAMTPQAGERYFRLQLLSATEKVSALIPVEPWCHFCWPELNSCAWQGLDEPNLIRIFTQQNAGGTFFGGAFRVENIQVVEGGAVNRPWLTVTEPALGTVLLASPFSQLEAMPAEQKVWPGVTQQVDWVLGYSHISARLLQTLALRDVLCIQQLQLQLMVTGRAVARFQKQQEGVFVVEEMIDDAPQAEETLPRLDDVLPENLPRPFDVAGVTVKLTFVLGHSEIPLTELAHIQPGAVYELGADKDREVKIYANKQLVAEGELIYIGDSNELGLEVTKLACQGHLES